MYQLAIDKGKSSDAMCCLATNLQQGFGGAPKDYKKAIELLNEAIKQDSPQAAMLMGLTLIEGYGIEKDLVKGLSFLQAAAKKNHPQAFECLGKA